jgi:hypothetical protein
MMDATPVRGVVTESPQEAWEIIEQDAVVLRWKLLVRKNRRLSFKRRCWAALGALLNEIKKRGRS